MIKRCTWCGSDPQYLAYHDEEWGVPLHDDRLLFEMLILEGTQAGLSWLTILRKRDNYRRAFDNFDAERIARYGREDVARLMSNAGIVRNRLKIEAAIKNARGFLSIRQTGTTFASYLWRFVDNAQVQNSWQNHDEIPAQTGISEQMSSDLKQQGFTFVGPTICYAFMQAVGMVNDHTVDCFRYGEIAGAAHRSG
jgi:DNA-3-methyladenine glycosylase I